MKIEGCFIGLATFISLFTIGCGLECSKWVNLTPDLLNLNQPETSVTCSTDEPQSCVRGRGRATINLSLFPLTFEAVGGLCWRKSACNLTCSAALLEVLANAGSSSGLSSYLSQLQLDECEYICCNEDNCNSQSTTVPTTTLEPDITTKPATARESTTSMETTTSIVSTTELESTTSMVSTTSIVSTKELESTAGTESTAAAEVATKRNLRTSEETSSISTQQVPEMGLICGTWLDTIDIASQPERNLTCSSSKKESCLRATGLADIELTKANFTAGLCWSQSACESATCESLLAEVVRYYVKDTLFASLKPTFIDCDFVCCNEDYCNRNTIQYIRSKQSQAQTPSSEGDEKSPNKAAERIYLNLFLLALLLSAQVLEFYSKPMNQGSSMFSTPTQTSTFPYFCLELFIKPEGHCCGTTTG